MVDNGLIKLYGRYVDDTLLLIKPNDTDTIHQALNGFDPNLRFTVDTFPDEIPHFLDIEMSVDGLYIYRKNTNTGQYLNFDSYTPWNYKVSCIRSLTSRAKRICADHKLANELSIIRKFASWNGFPRKICDGIIKRTLHSTDAEKINDEIDNKPTANIWVS